MALLKNWHSYLIELWYRPISLWHYLLMPLAIIYEKIIVIRQWLYQKQIKQTKRFSTPIIIVGNVTVGGTGKTPLVIWLVKFLRENGYRPGIVSRGYGGKTDNYPQTVINSSDPKLVGDEAVLLARLANCPVVVDPCRTRAVEHLLETESCDVVISDDGLQHYALGRDIEIAVIDGQRGLGNGWCLPAGPLREPANRLNSVDFIVTNGLANPGEHGMQLIPGEIYNIAQPELRVEPNYFAGHAVYAIAGIGNPERFFNLLGKLGLSIWPHSFPDHYQFTQHDILIDADTKVIMTAKDAVKCEAFADYRYWCLPVEAKLSPLFGEQLLQKLQKAVKGIIVDNPSA